MTEFSRGSTPSLTFSLETEMDLMNISAMWLTIEGAHNKRTWVMSELSIDPEEKTVTVELTQEETLQFIPGEVEAQIRFLTDTGKAFDTDIVRMDVRRILQGGVITNE